jgi:hypothetical protein
MRRRGLPDRYTPRGSKGLEEGPDCGLFHAIVAAPLLPTNASSVFGLVQSRDKSRILARRPLNQAEALRGTSFGRRGVARLPLIRQFFLLGDFLLLID